MASSLSNLVDTFAEGIHKTKCKCGHKNDLYKWAMSQTLPVGCFKWVEDTSEFRKDFIENCN